VKLSLWLILLLAGSAFGQQSGGNGVPGVNSSGSGGPPSGAAGGSLSGTYPNPALANPLTLPASTTGQVINGVSYSANYPQSTLSGRINACVADAEAGTNGNTSHKCDSSGEAYSQTDSSGVTITIGDPAGDTVTWIHPAYCSWSFTGFTGGTNDILDEYGGAAIEGQTPVNAKCMLYNNSTTTGARAVFETLPTTGGNVYFSVKGMGFANEGVGVSSGATMVINSTNDGSIFEDLLVLNYVCCESPILFTAATAYGGCCATTFNRIVAAGNMSSGPIVKFNQSNFSGQTQVEFTNSSLTHPAAGQPIIECSQPTTPDPGGGILALDNIYMEGNSTDLTTPFIISNGCQSLKISGLSIFALSGTATVGSTAPAVQLNGTYATSLDLSGLAMFKGFNNALPAIAVQNNIAGFNCASTPCNVYTDTNGDLAHYSSGPLQSPISGVIYADNVTGNGIGVAQAAWSSSAIYSLCNAVSYSAGNYLSVAGNKNVTPGTNSAIWYPVPNGNTPTQGYCAFYTAASQVTSTSAPTLQLGAGIYATNIGWMEPTVSAPGNPVVSIRGLGPNISIIRQTADISGGTNATLQNPVANTIYNFGRFEWENFSVDANYLAVAPMQVYAAQQYVIRDVDLMNAKPGSDHYVEFGAAGNTGWTYEMTLENLNLVSTLGGGTGAQISTTVSGGVPSFTITNGGSGYTQSQVVAYLAGIGSSGAPCSSMGTTTATVTSGVVTAISSTATGCVAPVYAMIYGNINISYGYKFTNAADSHLISGLTDGLVGNVAAFYVSNISSQLTFVKSHPIGTMEGIQDWASNSWIDTEYDTIFRYNVDLEAPQSVTNFTNNRFLLSAQSPILGLADYYIAQVINSPLGAPNAINITGDTCIVGGSGVGSGYHHFVTGLGGTAAPLFVSQPGPPSNCSAFNVSPQFLVASVPVAYRDDFFTTNAITSSSIGSPSGQSCATSTTFLNNNSPGNLSAISGTAGNGTGEACVGAGGAYSIFNAATASTEPWSWDTRVIVPVLPETTAGSYQAGMVHTFASSPWTDGIGFHLSSANGAANDWYCRYGTTSTDSTVAAVASTWTRLQVYSDGWNVHWYINGVEACGLGGVGIGSMPTAVLASAWTSVAGSSTSVTMGIDYEDFKMAVSR
jgi:hypothetical protein